MTNHHKPTAAFSQLDEVVAQLTARPRDPNAWEKLFILCWPYVLALAHRNLSRDRNVNLADAEDVAQEVFLKLARAWHNGDIKVLDGNSLRTLLAVMTRRLVIDSLRTQHRLRRDIRKEVPSEDVADPTDNSYNFSNLDWQTLLKTVEHDFSQDDRKVLEMRLEGYEVAEIAAYLSVATRTIERRLARLREVLKAYLKIE